MTFIKVQKNKSYFKRFQVKFRRRREGKTDYYSRKRLVVQDKTKYNTPKYRFVARITNKDVVCQVVTSKIRGDEVIISAYSHELPQYGLKVGLTNYAAAYCTGLLCARRLLSKIKLDKKYEGQTKVDGNTYLVDIPERGPKPFKAAFDVGLARTTTGARIFGCLKGACDGGLYVPHNSEGKRFPGYKEGKYDPKVHRAKIFGQHVAAYMKQLKESDEKRYNVQFSNFVKEGIQHGDLQKLYEKVHANIRANPILKKEEKKKGEQKDFRKQKRLTLQQRKKAVKAKKEKIVSEITKKRAEAGLLPEEQEIGVVKIKKKDRVKQISTKKPKAPKEKGGAKDAKGGKADDKKGGKAGAKDGAKPDAKAGAKPDAKAKK